MQLLQVHTVVDQPLTPTSYGRILCRPMGVEPIHFEWTGPGGGEVQLTDASGREAYPAPPGRYRIVAMDAEGSRADVVLDVEPMFTTALVVDEYRVTPASTGTSRDGCVEAVGSGLQDGWRFLWTHGVETEGPFLQDVPCGRYAIVALPHDDANPPTLIHTCAPATVGIRRGSSMEPDERAAGRGGSTVSFDGT